MARKSENVKLAELTRDTQVLAFIQNVLLDPMWSSIFGFQWVQQFSKLGWDDRQRLLAGITFINGARAGVDVSQALNLLTGASELIKGISKPIGMSMLAKSNPYAAVGVAAAEMVGEARSSRKTGGRGKPTQEDVDSALDILGRAGLLTGKGS